jgi:hypothetical protein
MIIPTTTIKDPSFLLCLVISDHTPKNNVHMKKQTKWLPLLPKTFLHYWLANLANQSSDQPFHVIEQSKASQVFKQKSSELLELYAVFNSKNGMRWVSGQEINFSTRKNRRNGSRNL